MIGLSRFGFRPELAPATLVAGTYFPKNPAQGRACYARPEI